MTDKKEVHLVCNAHIDPVWLWEWHEGIAEALSTFRTAAELCERDKSLIFNHNEVVLYEAVRTHDPSLFRRIQKLVKKGRWHIMGGWYLQPDCNMPCGESILRQMLSGRIYFKKYFGVEPTTAINFDSFGHSRGLVQILAKSGYDSYLFGRPGTKELKLPSGNFNWVGFDGSKITANRFKGWYNTPLGNARNYIAERIEQNDDNPLLILWGVGNHGGGPSRKDLADINDLISSRNDIDIFHSTPEAYFAASAKAGGDLPEYRDQLNPWAVGCYSSQVRVKQKHRELENQLYSLEKMASIAAAQGLMKYPQEDIQQALEDLLTAEFHDALPGSSIKRVEDAAIRQMEHGLEIISRLKTRAFFALSSSQKPAAEGEVPIMVLNHHPYRFKEVVSCEFNLPDFKDRDTFTEVEVYQNGKLLPSQTEIEASRHCCEWRKRVVFQADLKPSQINRFDCRCRVVASPTETKMKAESGRLIFKTRDLEVVINTRTGLIDRYRVGNEDYLQRGAFQPVVIADNADSWGMTVNSFRKIAGRFRLMNKTDGSRFSGLEQSRISSVRVIEDGAVRVIVEAVFSYNNSFICQRYELPRTGTEIGVETKVHWNEKDKMLKLRIPSAFAGGKYLGQVAYGVQELYDDGTECVSQKWNAIVSKSEDKAVTIINDGTYGSDFCGGEARMTLLRSPGYSVHPKADGYMYIPQDRYLPRVDQGERRFKFWFNAGKVSERLKLIERESTVKNEGVFAISFFPAGGGKGCKPILSLNDKVVQVPVIKKLEAGDDYVVRLYEPTGRKRNVRLNFPLANKTITISLGGFELKSLRVNFKTAAYSEIDLMENDL